MQTIKDGVFYRFGIRGLVVKIVKNLLISVLLFGIYFFLSKAYPEVWMQIDSLVHIDISRWLFLIVLGVAVLSIPVQIISALISYMTTQFMVSSTTLSLKTGFLLKQEESFPLRYINNVSSSQNILDQLFGVGTCIVEMTSDEKDAQHADNVSLSDLEQEKVLELKEILLARANTQQVTVASGVVPVQQ